MINLYSSSQTKPYLYSSNIEFNSIFISSMLKKPKKSLRKLFLENSIDWFTLNLFKIDAITE